MNTALRYQFPITRLLKGPKLLEFRSLFFNLLIKAFRARKDVNLTITGGLPGQNNSMHHVDTGDYYNNYYMIV